MMKRSLSLLLAVLLLTLCAVPALAAAPKVQRTEYEGNGIVEVEFTTENVRYKGAKVVVKDTAGKKLTATILEKDSDSITFKVKGVKAGKKYSYTISGVRKGNSGSYGKVKGTFTVPSGKLAIREIEFNPAYDSLEVEFTTLVQFKNLKVTIEDENGDRLPVTNLETFPDELEMDVEGMEDGETYTITISGVRVKGKGSYTSVSQRFMA